MTLGVEMIRIPYPIPAADRNNLIAAGKESCKQHENGLAKKEARANVDRIIGEITLKYGKECEE